MSDLALLLGCFAKLGCFVVLQTAPENFQDFRSGFARSANDKDAVEALLVRAIALGEKRFNVVRGGTDFALFVA
jgi:hypothetical protein